MSSKASVATFLYKSEQSFCVHLILDAILVEYTFQLMFRLFTILVDDDSDDLDACSLIVIDYCVHFGDELVIVDQVRVLRSEEVSYTVDLVRIVKQTAISFHRLEKSFSGDRTVVQLIISRQVCVESDVLLFAIDLQLPNCSLSRVVSRHKC